VIGRGIPLADNGIWRVVHKQLQLSALSYQLSGMRYQLSAFSSYQTYIAASDDIVQDIFEAVYSAGLVNPVNAVQLPGIAVGRPYLNQRKRSGQAGW
jgi:hypothetical protein